MAKSVINVTDFSGGYSSDLPDERMPDNMLRTGKNVYWEAGLRKRGGMRRYGGTFSVQPVAFHGHIRAYINGSWTHIVAVSYSTSDTIIRFLTDNATAKTYVEINSSFTFATDSPFDSDRFRFAIMKVNGEDAVVGVDSHQIQKPFVIYYDSGLQIENLETYDTRTRTNDDWYAGQYDVSESNPYYDKTAEAQSDTADDFPLATATNGDGFYVAGILTFTKFIITSASQFDGSPVAVYEYYKGNDTWGTLTMVTTPSWTDSAGDRTFEFDYPQDWEKWDGNEALDGSDNEVTGTLYNRFVIRVRFTTAPTSAQTADKLTVYHTQYLTQIMAGDIPHQIATHNSRLFLASGSNVNYSPPGRITGWNEYDTETFVRGGDKIQTMVTHRGYLCVIKGATIYGLFGNSVENWVVKELDSTIGSNYPSSVAVINQTVFFIGSDNYIYGFNGDIAKKISKHIKSDLDADLSSYQPYAVAHKGWYLVDIGTNLYKFDPDTVREDDMGDGIVSIWKYNYPTIVAENFISFSGDNDTGSLIGIGQDYLRELETSYYSDEDGAGNVNIAVDVKTKDISFGQFGLKKNYTRIKPDIEKAGDYTFTMYADHENTNISVTMASGTGSGHYTEDISIPYTIDGKDLTLRFQNTSSVFAAIYGIALEVARRVF